MNPGHRRRAFGVSGRCGSDVARLPSSVPASRHCRSSTRRAALPSGIARRRSGGDRLPRSGGICRRVVPADTRIESSGDGLGVSCRSSRGTGNGQHRRGLWMGTLPNARRVKPKSTRARRCCAAGGTVLTYANGRRRSRNPAPASQVSHPSTQYRPLVTPFRRRRSASAGRCGGVASLG